MGIGLIQPWHLVLILLIVLIVFGAGKLGQVGGALGHSVKEFKSTVSDGSEEDEQPDAKRVEAPAAKTATRTALPHPEGTRRTEETLRREEI